MTLSEVIAMCLFSYNQGIITYFKPVNDGVVYCISGYQNKINGIPVDYIVDLHVGKHVHKNHRFSVFELLKEYEICEGVK